MPRAKGREFFNSDWLRNCNTMKFLVDRRTVYNPSFYYGNLATFTRQAGLNNYKLSVKEREGHANVLGPSRWLFSVLKVCLA